MAAGGCVTYPKVTELLKKEVEKKGQRKVSRETGIALLSVQRYLKGESEPTQASLQKLADYLKVEVDYLRDGGIYAGRNVPLESAQKIASYKEESEREYWKAQQIRWELLHPDDLEEIAGEIEKARRSNQLCKEMTAAREKEKPE
jgi:transcriptional regulator with XRE-family HTH domain